MRRNNWILAAFLLALIFVEVFSVFAEEEEWDLPDYDKEREPLPDGDIDNDGDADWRYSRKEDDFGNDVEVWGVDPGENEPNGPEGDGEPYDEYFARLFSKNGNKYFVGKCMWEGGINEYTIYVERIEEDGEELMRFVRVVQTSEDGGADDVDKPYNKPGRDKFEFTYDPEEGEVTTKHYDKDGNEIEEETTTQEAIQWKSPGDFNDLPPYMDDFKWSGELMHASSPRIIFIYGVGGIAIPVDKLSLLAPYIALAVSIVAITVGTMYARKRWSGRAVFPKP